MIDTIFAKFKTKSSFEQALNSNEISEDTVVFIEDTGEIYARGSYYIQAKNERIVNKADNPENNISIETTGDIKLEGNDKSFRIGSDVELNANSKDFKISANTVTINDKKVLTEDGSVDLANYLNIGDGMSGNVDQFPENKFNVYNLNEAQFDGDCPGDCGIILQSKVITNAGLTDNSESYINVQLFVGVDQSQNPIISYRTAPEDKKSFEKIPWTNVIKTVNSNAISISDEGNYFDTDNVESVLQEIGSDYLKKSQYKEDQILEGELGDSYIARLAEVNWTIGSTVFFKDSISGMKYPVSYTYTPGETEDDHNVLVTFFGFDTTQNKFVKATISDAVDSDSYINTTILG